MKAKRFGRIWAASVSLLFAMAVTFSLPSSLAASVASQAKAPARVAASIESPNLRIEFDSSMRSRIVAKFGGKDIELGPFSESETLSGADHPWSDFVLASQKSERVSDGFGSGEKVTLTGKSGDLQKTVAITIYDDFPTLAAFDVSYTNTGRRISTFCAGRTTHTRFTRSAELRRLRSGRIKADPTKNVQIGCCP